MMPSGQINMAGVLGYPIKHSRSPLMHGFWLKKYNIPGSFIPIEVTPENLSALLKSLPEKKLSGVAVTIPHKEAVMESLDEIDSSAKAIGAVNMITVLEGGKLKGQNTDGFGFISNIKENSNWDPKRGSAVVLGAGGAARAVVYGLSEAGVEKIILTNRTREKAEKIASDLSPIIKATIDVKDWEERDHILKEAGLLVNTTSLGMDGQRPLEISLDALPAHALVTDIVYAPLETDLLKQAKTRGNPTVDGLGMLMHQARPQFEAWFGRDPEVTSDLRETLVADIQKASHD